MIPAARKGHVAVWSDGAVAMFVHGGQGQSVYCDSESGREVQKETNLLNLLIFLKKFLGVFWVFLKGFKVGSGGRH